MTQKSILDRIRDSLETTGAGLEQEVKRKYSHECGHMGVPAGDGLLTGDGVAIADQILRETMALAGWRSMDSVARCEAIKRAFYLAWRRVFGLTGQPDCRPFGPRCCGFARAMGELIPGFPAEDSVNCGEEFNSEGMADQLNKAARLAANNREAVLDQPYHLFFFSAVDGDRRTRFFDIMKGHEFSFAETATSAPRLGPCVETAYRDANGARHHVHRNYGQIRTETAREAMEQIAKQTILTQVTQLAETLTHREALPVWKVIFEKLGCESAAFSLESVTDYRIETDQGTSSAGQNRDNPTGKRTEVGGVHADAPAKTNGSTAKISLKTCPHCQREVLTLITDHTTDKRYCYHCVPNPEACPGAVFISRKMDQLHAAGKLETYSVEQRLKDLNDPPSCECGAVLDVLDGELCSKCEREAVRLAHRIRQRQAGEPVNTGGAAENESRTSPQNPTCLRLFDEPSPIALNTITLQPATTLLVGGIINPAGPTLNVVMAHGLWEPGATLPVVQLMLNPVSQEVQTVGEIFIADTWRPSTIISQLFRLPFGSCPSLLLPSVFLDQDGAVTLHAEFLKGFPDARRVLEDVKTYYGNPWDRVSMELHRASANMNKPRSGKESLKESEAMELSALLLSERHLVPELQAFMYAWKGSIEHFARGLATLGFDEFVQMFAHLTVNCQIPEQKNA